MLLGIFTNLEVDSKITKIKPSIVFEGDTITALGTKFNTTTNPLNISLIDGDGVAFAANIEPSVTSPQGFKFVAPSVSSTKSLLLKVSGGNVTSENGDTFPVVIFNKADADTANPSPPDEDINAENVNATTILTESLVLNDKALTSDANGTLSWNGKKFVNSSGTLVPKQLTINGYTMTVSNGSLVWNSHTVAQAGGDISATILKSGTSANGKLTLSGASTVSMYTSNGNASVYLAGSGMLAGVLRGEYDFAVDGGVVGAINLRNATLPVRARVTRAWYEVLTTLRSATDASLVGLSIPGDDVAGILTPIAISDASNPWDAGIHAAIQNGLISNISEKTTASRNVQITLAGEALTAGKVVVFLEYTVLP